MITATAEVICINILTMFVHRTSIIHFVLHVCATLKTSIIVHYYRALLISLICCSIVLFSGIYLCLFWVRFEVKCSVTSVGCKITFCLYYLLAGAIIKTEYQLNIFT